MARVFSRPAKKKKERLEMAGIGNEGLQCAILAAQPCSHNLGRRAVRPLAELSPELWARSRPTPTGGPSKTIQHLLFRTMAQSQGHRQPSRAPWLRQPSPCSEVPLPAFCITLVFWVTHGTREGRTTTTIAGLDTNTGVTCMFRATQHNAGTSRRFLSSRSQGGSVQSQKIPKPTTGQNRLPLPKERDVVLDPTKGLVDLVFTPPPLPPLSPHPADLECKK